jgi:hypothetical protein
MSATSISTRLTLVALKLFVKFISTMVIALVLTS